MKITAIETLRADAGWRIFSFLKVMTDSGIVGWSEYNESFGSAGLSNVIEALAPNLIGKDPRPIERLVSTLHVLTRQSRGGLNHQAIAAIENALLDIKGKDLGVPVYALFGGPVRDRIPLYWSHTGTYRVRNAEMMGVPPLRSHDDLAEHCADIRRRGFKALKTNILPFDGKTLTSFAPGFGRSPGWPELNWDNSTVRAAIDTLAAARAGAGPEMGLMLDINFHFKTEGFRRIADAVAPFDLTWLEIDTHDPAALALLRGSAPCPIASYETLCHRREFRPYLDAYAADVAIIDVVWNGLAESVKIAAMAEIYEVNCAPHNFYGHLCSVMSAHFCAAVPNFRIMEIDIDSVPWRDDFVTAVPVIENGELVLPTRPGWGIDINEAAVRARPPKA
ncbi:mandelate racemase/muconate lactonizing enzyme family protein [Limobrevibacterium gyesilva]|uniref:Mandelate racemase/muconate lactonizing enzyme family protein n=1 Tax=Limobrevibacterium gyesilva TaxID=2991712 RepID=A0AA42CDV3_9PROT|nr:mandelate racemase/muconate lactonizing enzyme family protein [Limobrevibacterium gyesilva]MCW3475323.1 mandelate racemase/muconate lactonizing enzyme family protein [Limobrevibacterium gyesilva]